MRALLEASRHDESAFAELQDRLSSDLAFGTAGMRAPMGPGFSRINPVTVQLITQGVADYLCKQDEDHGSTVVVGHDHRHNSSHFARLICETLRAKGIASSTFSRPVPTPFVPFAVRHKRASFGIMVTASHNPAADNGYKIYGRNGCQITSPADKEIAALINRQGHQLWDIKADLHHDDCDIYQEIFNSYIRSNHTLLDPIISTASFVPRYSSRPPQAPLKIVYTPMHGVGLEVVERLVSACNLPPLHAVPSQKHPDPDFRTVRFPNPEEGLAVLREAVAVADSVGASLIFANDPDADRFNLSERDPASGVWKVFNGNEIAAIFADYVWSNRETFSPQTTCYAMATSIVSSKFLKSMGLQEHFAVLETQTGFKNISNAAQAFEGARGEAKVLFAYEEAIGFLLNSDVWDKDGISALLVMYVIVLQTYDCGSTVIERLHAIYRKYGYFVQNNGYFACEPAAKINDLFRTVRVKLCKLLPGSDPGDLTGKCRIPVDSDLLQVEEIKDYPGCNMITFYFDSQGLSWLTLRASGTEPKVKFYSEVPSLLDKATEAQEQVDGRVVSLFTLLFGAEAAKLLNKLH